MHHLRSRPQLAVGEHDQLQREHRQRAADQELPEPPTDSTGRWSNASIAWLTRGNRRVPYRGIEKNNDWLHHRVAALNLRRLLTMGLTSKRDLGTGLTATGPPNP